MPAIASLTFEELEQHTLKMAKHLTDWVRDTRIEARNYPRDAMNLRETLVMLHDEFAGVLERLGCDVFPDEAQPDETVTADPAVEVPVELV